MGNAAPFTCASCSSDVQEASIFERASLNECWQKFVTDSSAREAFVRYIKEGTWVDKFPSDVKNVEFLIHDIILESPATSQRISAADRIILNSQSIKSGKRSANSSPSAKAANSTRSSISSMQDAFDVASSYINRDLKNGHHQSFLTTSTSNTISTLSNTAGTAEALKHATKSSFSESYSAPSCFSMDEMAAVMFTILYPYYVDSHVYKTWVMRQTSPSCASLDEDDHSERKSVAEVHCFSNDNGDGDSVSASFRNNGNTTPKSAQIPGIPSSSSLQRLDNLSSLHTGVGHGRASQLVLGVAAFYGNEQLTTMLSTKVWTKLVPNLLENLGIALTISDATTQGFPLVYVNNAFENLTGYSRLEMLSKGLGVLQGLETNVSDHNKISRALRHKKGLKIELTNYMKNGVSFRNLLILSPVFDIHHTYRYVLGMQFDVTRFPVGDEDNKLMRDILALLPYILCKQ